MPKEKFCFFTNTAFTCLGKYPFFFRLWIMKFYSHRRLKPKSLVGLLNFREKHFRSNLVSDRFHLVEFDGDIATDENDSKSFWQNSFFQSLIKIELIRLQQIPT